jgi:formylglycine-generating enzyme required for sulfatase activity
VVWLNALTEWVNAKTGSGFTPVYHYDSNYVTVAKNSNYNQNFEKPDPSAGALAYANPAATGFRLPTSDQWEMAARWRGHDSTNTQGNSRTNSDSASGATASYRDAAATGAVAWYYDNSSKTHPVKEKAGNRHGLYDMSGNVSEWCDTWQTLNYYHSIRGGGWSSNGEDLQAGVWKWTHPGNAYNFYGFRIARKAQ